MAHISAAAMRKMKNCYRHDIARHLAIAALCGNFVTYDKLSEKFGGTARGWGDVLCGIAIRCHDARLPLLSTIVVNAKIRLPSMDAVLYHDLGLVDDAAVAAEQERCFGDDWRATPLAS